MGCLLFCFYQCNTLNHTLCFTLDVHISDVHLLPLQHAATFPSNRHV